MTSLTGTASRSRALGSAQNPRAAWCPVGSQKPPTLQHTWLGLALGALGLALGTLAWSHGQRKGKGVQMERGDKDIPSPILSVPEPALGFVSG